MNSKSKSNKVPNKIKIAQFVRTIFCIFSVSTIFLFSENMEQQNINCLWMLFIWFAFSVVYTKDCYNEKEKIPIKYRKLFDTVKKAVCLVIGSMFFYFNAMTLFTSPYYFGIAYFLDLGFVFVVKY